MLTIKIIGANNEVKAECSHDENAQLCYEGAFEKGERITLCCDNAPCYIAAALDDAMPLSVLYMSEGEYSLEIPFDEGKTSYCPKSFTGENHFITARKATEHEISQRRNLAFNPYDHHKNTVLFPHATANVETRGEAVFAARNAINGNIANFGHGIWPFESWGIQRREDAEFIVDFGREINADGIGIVIRCDFPHDNWWHTVSVEFSDGSRETFTLKKTSLPQYFDIKARKIVWAKLCDMKKDESDPSPFPALTAFEVYGR